jgi:hypothetical protein
MMAHGQAGRLALDARSVARVKELLSEGLSLRDVARQATADGFPVSKTTVDRIKRGQHLEKGESTSRVGAGFRRVAKGRQARCEICGAKLDVVPCVACSIRAQIKLRNTPRPASYVEE